LVTGTLSVLYSLLKPFKYPFPLIYNLPEVLLPILDAPGGLLVGIQKGEKFLLKEKLHDNFSCMYICLDEKKIYADSQTLKDITIPVFDGFEKIIQTHYSALNPDTNYHICNFNSKTGPTSRKKKLRYYYQPEERLSATKVLEIFKNTIFEKIIRFIPPQPIYNEKRQLSYSKVNETIIKNSSYADHKFLNQFVQTQTFTHFLELFYEMKVNI